MNLQSKFGYCMTTQTLKIAADLSGRGHKNEKNYKNGLVPADKAANT